MSLTDGSGLSATDIMALTDTTYGHSIKDRMVAALEPLYDKAESNYEHGMIQKAIDSVQSLN